MEPSRAATSRSIASVTSMFQPTQASVPLVPENSEGQRICSLGIGGGVTSTPLPLCESAGADEPAEELAGPIGRVGQKPFGLQALRLRRSLALTFRTGGMVLFIHWRRRAPRRHAHGRSAERPAGAAAGRRRRFPTMAPAPGERSELRGQRAQHPDRERT